MKTYIFDIKYGADLYSTPIKARSVKSALKTLSKDWLGRLPRLLPYYTENDVICDLSKAEKEYFYKAIEEV